MKSKTLKTLAGVLLSLIITLSGAFAPVAWAQDQKPIKIGVTTALSGALSVLGEQVKRAAEFAVEQANAKGGINGNKVEVKFADTEYKPDVARKQAEQLALEGYNLLTGNVSSGESLAIGPLLERWDAVYVIATPKSTKLTGDSCQSRMFRVCQEDKSDIAAVAAWLKTRPEKKWAVIAFDMAWGRDADHRFREAAQKLGLNVEMSLFSPAGRTTDFAPYIQKLKSAAPEGVFVALAGGDAINFINQAKQFGLLDKTTVAGIAYTYDVVVDAVGETGLGLWGTINYSATIDTPQNKAFVEAWKAAHNGVPPTDYEGQAYHAVTTILQAVKKAGSSKPADVAKALEGGTFDTIYGTAKIRAEDHQMVLPNYYGRVTMVDGKARNVVTLTLPADKATPPIDPACTQGNHWK